MARSFMANAIFFTCFEFMKKQIKATEIQENDNP